MLNNFDRDHYIEWILIIENYSLEEKEKLIGLTDSDLENKFKLALIKSEDEALHY